MTKNDNKAILCAGLAVISWSTVATAFKLALESLTHFELLLIASCTSMVIFAVLITFQNKWKLVVPLFRKRWLFYMLLGLLNPVAYYLVLFKSYSLLPAQIAQPINYIWPILLTVLLAVFSHRTIRGVKYIGLFISLCGVTSISVGSGMIDDTNLSFGGLSLAFLSALLWAVYWMVNDKVKNTVEPTVSMFLCFLFGSAYLITAAWITGINTITTQGLLSGIYVGCFEMGLPFIAFGYAIRKTNNPALINQMCYLSPFLSLFFISIVLGERIVITTYIGLLLIVTGIMFNQYISKRETTN